MSFFALVRMEAWKMMRRGRTWLGPLGLLGVVLPMAVMLKYGDPAVDIQRWLPDAAFQFYGSPFNALFLTRLALQPTVVFFMPLFVSLVAGDQVSGEAGDGTLRMVLARPVNRVSLMAAKFIVSALYAVVLTAFLGLSAMGIGYLFFGMGGLVTFWGGLKFFSMQEGLYLLGLAYLASAVTMLAIAGIAFLLSVFFNSSLAPVIGCMAALLIIGTIGQLSFLDPIRPYLFTTHMELFQKVFEVPLDYKSYYSSLATLMGWCIGSFGIAVIVFSRKDILT